MWQEQRDTHRLYAPLYPEQHQQPYCSQEVRPAVRIMPRDAHAGESLSCGATGEIQEGDYVDTLSNPVTDSDGNCSATGALLGATGRDGRYDIRVSHPGYDDWFIYDVQVTRSCNLNTMALGALMTR